MKFINKILEQRWRKKLDYYYSQAQHYYSEYKSKKELVEARRKPAPIWMDLNSNLTYYKVKSEEALKNYRYWNNKFKKLKKKLNNLN